MQNHIALFSGLAAAVVFASAPALAHPGAGIGGGFSAGMGVGGGFSSGGGVRASGGLQSVGGVQSVPSRSQAPAPSQSQAPTHVGWMVPETARQGGVKASVGAVGGVQGVLMPGPASTQVDRASNGAVRSVLVTPNFTSGVQHPATISPSGR